MLVYALLLLVVVLLLSSSIDSLMLVYNVWDSLSIGTDDSAQP